MHAVEQNFLLIHRMMNTLTPGNDFISQTAAFADNLIILTRGETVTGAENFMNLALTKVQKWAQNNRLEFNEDKLKVMLLTRRKRRGKKGDSSIY